MALVLLVLAGAAAFVVLRMGDADNPLRDAGSPSYVRPIGPVRLVGSMDPVDSASGGPTLPGRDPATVPDSRIQVDIAVKLEEMGLPVEPLDITVEDRLVILEGRVEDTLLRDAIEVTVRSVEGVREVDNQLEVLRSE